MHPLTTPQPCGALPPLCADGRMALFGRLLALGLLQALLAATAALGMRALFDNLHGPGPLPVTAAALAAGVAGAGLVLGLTQLLVRQYSARWAESLGQRYAAAVRSMLVSHLFRLPPHQHQRLRHGHLMARFTSDLAALRRWVGRTLAPLLVAGATVLLMLVALAVLVPVLAGLLLLALAVAAALGWHWSVQLEHSLRQERRQRWALAGQLGERLAEAAVVQAHAQGERELRRLHRRQQRMHDAAVVRARWSALLKALPAALGAAALGALAAWGALEVQRGAWTPGSLAGLITLLGLALAPTRDLALALASWRAWRVSREKLTSFLRLPSMNEAAPGAPPPARDGELHLARAATNGQAAWSVAVPPRTSLAVCGPCGSGKSQLLLALAGLCPGDDLHATLDGQDLASAAPSRSVRAVALVAADLPLLRGTIAANLRYRRRRVEPEAMWRVLAQVGLAGAVAALPLGLATPVGEGGRNLPSGLRARLSLARALAASPVLLLIDDFDQLTEGDPERDQALADLLRSPPCTIVMASRSARWRSRCSQVLDVGAGAAAAPHLALVHAA